MHLFGTHTSGEVTRPPFAGSVLVPAIFKYNHFVEEEFMFPKAGFEEDRLNPEIISSKIMSSRASYNHFIPVLKRKYKRKNAKSLRLKNETNESFQCVSCETIANDKIEQHSLRPCNRILRKTTAKKAASNIQNTQNKTENSEDEIDMLDLNEVIRNELKPYNFCFEHVPANEPWFRVFTRQDESKEEIFEYYGNTVYRELPYEMGPLPPKQGKCNLCQTPDKKLIVPKKEPIQVLKQPKIEPAEIQETKLPSHGKIRKLANKALLSIEMRRKSPREHASTLAIMSCLLQETQNNLTDNYECDIDENEEDVSERSVSKTDHKLESKADVDKSLVQKCENKNVSLKNNIERVRRQPSPCHKSNSGKNSDKDSSVHSSKKNSRLTEDLVGVKKLERDIDYHLLHSFEEWNLENSINLASQNQKSVFTHDVPLDDRSFDSRTKLSNSNKVASRLKIFNFFSTGKKRKNKTGWPKKKRVSSRQHFVKFTNRPNGFSNIDNIDNCERLEKTINEDDCTPSIGIEAGKKYSSNTAFSNQALNVVKNDFTCKTDDSDLLAASSDSLDTVFDVGSQIKTEDQQKIIASSKYNTRNNSFVRSKQICVSKVKKRIKGKGKKKHFNRIKVEKFEAIQDNCKNSSIPNVIKRNEAEPVSPAASIISTRGLRKPRGCWYRER